MGEVKVWGTISCVFHISNTVAEKELMWVFQSKKLGIFFSLAQIYKFNKVHKFFH